jgi:hypothetical protein
VHDFLVNMQILDPLQNLMEVKPGYFFPQRWLSGEPGCEIE